MKDALGRDAGSLEFERSALGEQLGFAVRGVAAAGAAKIQVALTPLSEAGERLVEAVRSGVDGAEVVTDRGREAGRGYYRDLCFKVNAWLRGEVAEVGDGGFTDWTARLIANQKERLLISGLATERLASFPFGRGRR
jgi:hypothetical protein